MDPEESTEIERASSEAKAALQRARAMVEQARAVSPGARSRRRHWALPEKLPRRGARWRLGASRAKSMPSYRLLFFHGPKLDRWETIEAPSSLDAIEQAAARPKEERTELWLDGTRLALFRQVGQRH